MYRHVLDDFPYPREEFRILCSTVDTLTMEVMEVFEKTSLMFSSAQVLKVQKCYQGLKYPLMLIWEYYRFGDVEEIMFPATSLSDYQAFKVKAIDTLKQIIAFVTSENPFNLCGVIPNSEKVVEKMLIAYRHLYDNLVSGNLELSNRSANNKKISNLLSSMLHRSFMFEAISFEIYESGCCVQYSKCNTIISSEHSIFFGMMFKIENNPTYIDDKFSLPTSSNDLLEDRIQYGSLRPIDYTSGISSKPIVCNLFPQDKLLRFATPSPLRLVEFLGDFKTF